MVAARIIEEELLEVDKTKEFRKSEKQNQKSCICRNIGETINLKKKGDLKMMIPGGKSKTAKDTEVDKAEVVDNKEDQYLDNVENVPNSERDLTSFRKEIQNLINRQSLENNSNTPDFILAEFLTDCLDTFDKAVCRRDNWYGDCKWATKKEQ